jgi:hypothetical protein
MDLRRTTVKLERGVLAIFSTVSTVFGTYSAPSFKTAISTVSISQVHSPSGEDQGHQITSCFW